MKELLIKLKKDLQYIAYYKEASQIENILERYSQFAGSPFDVEIQPMFLPRRWKYDDQDMKERDESRQKNPRYTPHEYMDMGDDTNEEKGNKDGLTPFNMSGESEVKGPALVFRSNDPSVTPGILKEYEDTGDNTDNNIDKKFTRGF